MSKPLTDLLKKDGFQWTQGADSAFTLLNAAMSDAPVLAFLDMTKTFTIKIDASNTGVGVVLMKKRHPVAFVISGLSLRQQLLSAYVKELLAIIFTIKKWHYYLLDRYFGI